MKKWIKWLIALLVIVIIVGGGFFLLNKGGESTSVEQEKTVTTKVKQGELKIKATGTGAIMPENQQMPDYDKLVLQAQMDELDIPNIKKDQEVDISVTALPGKTYKGKVTEIAEQGQVQNGVSTFAVTISIDDTTDLKAGMTADASILVGEKQDALYVPIEAVQKDDDNNYYVMVPAKDKKGKQTKKKVTVETGLHNEDNIEITKGLEKGDKVVLPSQKSSTTPEGF
ncbi:efflux RND transporter periplasmic adaptor subunit [Listeria ilorinensis]|uniref:efflux RND transporter periplasmic adaptor subunit n=1 Tax=Listeria ilorinensis TaxID=2867439 RepID=UPI001EF606BF|nr:HlyD family efflux transporter periplasmic adaptor subunit [Listeria ilorinensis]